MIKRFIQIEKQAYRQLLRTVPTLAVTLFVLAVVSMNLLANKELVRLPWLALDCGYALSWLPFLVMDCICKVFGGKAAMRISVLAIAINLLTFFLFKLILLTPGYWGEYYANPIPQINDAINHTIGGSSWIVLGSAFAMLVSSGVNALINVLIGKHLQRDNFSTFALRSFVSTGIAQFVDNLVFCLVVSIPLFGWNMKQTLVCSLTCATLELLLEITFSRFGYRIARQWQQNPETHPTL